jgi:hypothetical protein
MRKRNEAADAAGGNGGRTGGRGEKTHFVLSFNIIRSVGQASRS